MTRKFAPFLALSAAMVPISAQSSSDAAWDEFRAAVEEACLAAVEAPDDATTEIEVNPFGSESFGIALLTVTLAEGGTDRMACIYDKQDKTVEMTAPFLPQDETEDETQAQ